MGRDKEELKDRPTDRQADRQTDRQTDRTAERQTDMHTDRTFILSRVGDFSYSRLASYTCQY